MRLAESIIPMIVVAIVAVMLWQVAMSYTKAGRQKAKQEHDDMVAKARLAAKRLPRDEDEGTST